MQAWLLKPWAKPLVFTLCLLPCTWLFYAALTDGLGANPAEALLRSTGDWTLRFLCIVLAVTPLMRIKSAVQRWRRKRTDPMPLCVTAWRCTAWPTLPPCPDAAPKAASQASFTAWATTA